MFATGSVFPAAIACPLDSRDSNQSSGRHSNIAVTELT
jgi:hypothetical protein